MIAALVAQDSIARYRPLLVASNIALFVIGALFMADAVTGAEGFKESTWGSFALSFPAEMWAGIMMSGCAMCLIGLIHPVRWWMVTLGGVVQCLNFIALAYSAIVTGGEYAVGVYASFYFAPFYTWLSIVALLQSTK